MWAVWILAGVGLAAILFAVQLSFERWRMDRRGKRWM
jgi:hypothetical protein